MQIFNQLLYLGSSLGRWSLSHLASDAMGASIGMSGWDTVGNVAEISVLLGTTPPLL